MKKLYHFLLSSLVISLTLNAGAQCVDEVNVHSFSYGNKSYEVITEKKSWEDAADCALTRGGYLVQIDSQAEQDAVYGFINDSVQVAFDYTLVMDGGGIAYVWIGATDKNTEGTWIWDGDNDNSGDNFWNGEGNAGAGGGSAVDTLYNNWGGTLAGAANEPDDFLSNQDAAAIALNGWPAGMGTLGQTMEWNDIAISNEIYFVIEFDSALIGNHGLLNQGRSDIKIYPNPAKDYIMLLMDEESFEISNIEICNMLGIVMDCQVELIGNHYQVNLSQISNGVYFLRILSEYKIKAVRKFIKQE
jgi:hypothetical protein